MKKFKLSEYKNQKTALECGKEVEILKTDMKGKYPVLVLVRESCVDITYRYTIDGEPTIANNGSVSCLYFKPVEYVAYTYVYGDENGHMSISNDKWDSLDGVLTGHPCFITTAEIKWTI